MFKIQSIFQDNYYINNKDKILSYCKSAFQDKSEPSHVNMWHENWEDTNSTFPYLLYNSNRFKDGNGDMFILLDNGNIVSNSGINISEFDKFVAIGGVRTWLIRELRGKVVVGRNLLPAQVKWAEDKKLKTIALTFNEYNKRLIPYFSRTGLGIEKKRRPGSMFYNGQFKLDFPVWINNTQQWVIYHKIDELYMPEWESIKV